MSARLRETIKSLLPAAARNEFASVRTHFRRSRIMRDLQRDHRRTQATGKYVTYLVMQGLTNRLKAHVMAAHVADRLGRVLVPVWYPTPECHATFEDLFDSPDAGWTYRTHRMLSYTVGADIANPGLYALHVEKADLLVLDLDWQYIYTEHLLNRVGGIEAFQALFARTATPQADILRRVEATVSGWDRPMIGVQIRRGDFVTFRQAISIQAYIDATERALEQQGDAGILLSSDASHAELEPFLVHFGSRVAFSESRGRGEQGGVCDALHDLLVLSRCHHLVLTPISGFGDVAARIGGVSHTWVSDG